VTAAANRGKNLGIDAAGAVICNRGECGGYARKPQHGRKAKTFQSSIKHIGSPGNKKYLRATHGRQALKIPLLYSLAWGLSP
jgi:hypothetical protein